MSEEILIKDYEEKNNEFCLDNKVVGGTANEKKKKKVYTESEKEELLDNFIEVPLDMINKIKSPSFIRYEANNEFRLGGYVAANPLTLNDKHTDMPHTYIKLQIGSGSNYKSWLVKHNEITKIWVQVPIQTSISNKLIKESVTRLNANIKKIVERLEKLERQVARLSRS